MGTRSSAPRGQSNNDCKTQHEHFSDGVAARENFDVDLLTKCQTPQRLGSPPFDTPLDTGSIPQDTGNTPQDTGQANLCFHNMSPTDLRAMIRQVELLNEGLRSDIRKVTRRVSAEYIGITIPAQDEDCCPNRSKFSHQQPLSTSSTSSHNASC